MNKIPFLLIIVFTVLVNLLIDFIEMIHISSENLLILLSNILNVSQIESGLLSINTVKNEYIGFINERLKIVSLVT